MAKVAKFNLEGRESGEVSIDDALAKAEAHGQSVKDYLIAVRRNQRQWSAATRGRAEVAHSGQKPHKQKGTGNARQGCLAAPQYKGGGVVFGPRPKFDQHVRINRKERRQAIRALLGEKIRGERFFVLEDPKLEGPKTQVMAKCLKAMGIQGSVLVLAEAAYVETETEGKKFRASAPQKHEALRKSLRNLPKVEFQLVANVSGHDLMRAQNVILTEAALAQLQGGEL